MIMIKQSARGFYYLCQVNKGELGNYMNTCQSIVLVKVGSHVEKKSGYPSLESARFSWRPCASHFKYPRNFTKTNGSRSREGINEGKSKIIL